MKGKKCNFSYILAETSEIEKILEAIKRDLSKNPSKLLFNFSFIGDENLNVENIISTEETPKFIALFSSHVFNKASYWCDKCKVHHVVVSISNKKASRFNFPD